MSGVYCYVRIDSLDRTRRYFERKCECQALKESFILILEYAAARSELPDENGHLSLLAAIRDFCATRPTWCSDESILIVVDKEPVSRQHLLALSDKFLWSSSSSKAAQSALRCAKDLSDCGSQDERWVIAAPTIEHAVANMRRHGSIVLLLATGKVASVYTSEHDYRKWLQERFLAGNGAIDELER
jgi:hypothetical protein